MREALGFVARFPAVAGSPRDDDAIGPGFTPRVESLAPLSSHPVLELERALTMQASPARWPAIT